MNQNEEKNMGTHHIDRQDIPTGKCMTLWWSSPSTNADGSPLTDLWGFNIYRGTSSGNYGGTAINGTYPYQGVSFADSGVISGQTYYYAIRTVDSDGHEGPFSMEVWASLASETQPPLTPTGLSITEKETELMLTWNPNYESDFAGYNIYRGTSSGYYSRINFALLSGASYVDRNVSAGQTYYYVVTAIDENGNESGFSNEVSGMIAQGDIWINSPTRTNPATIDFSYLMSQDVDKQEMAAASRAVINYDYNGYLSLIYYEMKDSYTGEIVYWGYDWQPPDEAQNHSLVWDGKYSFSNECVPDGSYDVRLSGVLGALTPETEERRSVNINNCDESKMKVEITTPISTQMNISNVPQMPVVTFHADIQPANVNISNVTFKWYLEITFNQNGRNDKHRIPASGTVNITGSGDWTPDWGGLLSGGTAHVFVTASVGSLNILDDQNGFQIKGTNPTQTQLFNMANDIEERAVCWKESTHRQFNTTQSYTGVGWPLFGPPDGWGLMQGDPPQNERHLWHWSENLTWGIGYLNSIRQNSQNYLNTWYDVAVSNSDPNDDWTWDPHIEHPEWVWDDSFARYNTGAPIYSPNGNGGVRNCSVNPVGCNYANLVRGFINNPPW